MRSSATAQCREVKSLIVAGLSGGSGKSMVSVGLTRALLDQGSTVVPFKKGPDYIDAGWLTAAAKTPCYNLDPYLMSAESVLHSFHTHLGQSDYAIIEGNRGLYDGVNAEGQFSTATLAKQLDQPVLLVVNCSKTTRTIGALVLGCCAFDDNVRFAGVILNQIATPRHEFIIRQTIEKYTPLSVLGIMPRLKQDVFPMRHLGVTPLQEYENADEAVCTLADLVRSNFDLEELTAAMRRIPRRPVAGVSPDVRTQKDVVIGVLRDMAFQFYYEENLEMLKNQGAKLVTIDAISSKTLPDNLDGLYIGGGFPETSARQLAENRSFRESIRMAAESGLPVYAECGGLIYLGRSICMEGKKYPLTGVFPVEFGLSVKPQAHGYSAFTVEGDNSFYPVGTEIKGHEFRYSTVERWDGTDDDLVLKMERGTGFINGRDGLKKHNVLAMYTHVLAPGTPLWAEGLLKAARKYQQQKFVR
ncbi:cobyrinate a,c-diamide synthase [Desulfogranum marinum]|uniref:cobyrinate a,c-diamide synthase n=1 Tax=Desulfogranum marinum TaxID=453220 RepID=UPI0029C7CECF|nr:cobyrinate a,c-diamide synthase [Desulfogranum marinum]